MKKSLLINSICFTLILLFAYTAMSKLLGLEVFKAVLEATPIVKAYAGLIAWALPVVELSIALLLILPKYRLQGLIAAFVLLLLLTGYLSWMMAFHKELPCNCGGVLKSLTWKQHLVFNLFFTALDATGMTLLYRQQRLVNRFLYT